MSFLAHAVSSAGSDGTGRAVLSPASPDRVLLVAPAAPRLPRLRLRQREVEIDALRSVVAKPEIDPTLAERQSDAAPRHDCRVGNDAELTTLRCDKLMMLALRGFERPCAWSEAECGRRWTFKSEHPGT